MLFTLELFKKCEFLTLESKTGVTPGLKFGVGTQHRTQ